MLKGLLELSPFEVPLPNTDKKVAEIEIGNLIWG
jgi:hypothetical protein